MSTVMTDDAGRSRIVLGGGGAARLFGVPFLLALSTAPTKRTSHAFQVELAAESRNNQVVGLFDDGEAALKHGQQLSALAGLPLVDRRYTEPPADE